MLYGYFVKKLVRQSFDHVNSHRWDELLKPVAPNVHSFKEVSPDEWQAIVADAIRSLA
jgi:hypothetical protein